MEVFEIFTLAELEAREQIRLEQRRTILARNDGKLTLDELRIVEPAFVTLERIAYRLHATLSRRERLAAWYGEGKHFGIKHHVVALFGWCRSDGPAILQGSLAYNLAYDRALAILEGEQSCNSN